MSQLTFSKGILENMLFFFVAGSLGNGTCRTHTLTESRSLQK
jgi:hypothetical protein